ncbi:hypothetical protein F960_02872 [Acinetobacter gerneri DSM 14967 = CIP 107464 = MTCC 9824]|uniref:Uncharacterized protein n=2 Tax=Acinetobacter gerneri TaxID=202952 RepID=N8ZNT5_9GAMM|nr:hypothetical protein F960_02872 [Acinetobacter gerneri DSM 14967 = CIP 107464 = MTCC 9824]
MDRVGSSTNHLFLHLSCLLAFHLYFHQNLCPVPSFLVLDQPSQVCFPEIYPYETLKDNYELYIKSLDIIEVKAIFKFLLKYTKEYYKDFQIILLEHAFIDEPWFTELLVEEQWIDDKALIPSSWIN